MAEKREFNPLIKTALELGPVIAFFIAYLMFKDDTFTVAGREYSGFIFVTAGFMPLIILTTGIGWKLTGHISKMQIMTLVLVIVFGGLTVWLNDPKFLKIKPTIFFSLMGGILGVGLWRGQSYLRYVMEGMMPLQDKGWMILTRRLMWFLFATALANELIWRFMSETTWVYFKTFGDTAAMFVFFMSQTKLFAEYAIEEDSQT